MPLPQKEFDEACLAFVGILIANASNWKGYFGAAYSTRMRECIKSVRAACDDMEIILDADDKRPVKELTPEEYEAKVAAGKKLTFSPDPGSKMKQGD